MSTRAKKADTQNPSPPVETPVMPEHVKYLIL